MNTHSEHNGGKYRQMNMLSSAVIKESNVTQEVCISDEHGGTNSICVLLQGSSIIRMLQFFLGKHVFQKGLTVSVILYLCGEKA